MRIACVSRIDEIDSDIPDLIVLPEYTNSDVLQEFIRSYPTSIVVSAVELNGRSHGRLIHRRRNWIDYRKIGSDGRTAGVGKLPKRAVVHFPHMSVGVVICMDIETQVFVSEVVRQLRTSETKYKFLCIPADMGSQWFGSEILLGDFEGIHVAMSNRPNYSPPLERLQAPSFITDGRGWKAVKRIDSEAIWLNLD